MDFFLKAGFFIVFIIILLITGFDILLSIVIFFIFCLLLWVVISWEQENSKRNSLKIFSNIFQEFASSKKATIKKFLENEIDFEEKHNFKESNSFSIVTDYESNEKIKVLRDNNDLCFFKEPVPVSLINSESFSELRNDFKNLPYEYDKYLFILICNQIIRAFNKTRKPNLSEKTFLDNEIHKSFKELNDSNFNLSTLNNFSSYSININNIKYFSSEGKLEHVTKIKGGGSSTSGAIVGGLIAGGAGAIIGSREEITTDINTIDNRFVWLVIVDNNKVKKIKYDFEFFDVFNELIPEKEYTFVSLNNKL